jgi:hypothetical protein
MKEAGMFRAKFTVCWLAPMLVAAAILSTGCGASHPEQQQLQQFFRASGLRDDQTLANFAVVSFDPKTEGQVMGFTIVSVSETRAEPLKIKELSKAVEDAQAADKEFNDRKKEYQDSHVDSLKRVLAAETANKKLSGPDSAVQAQWTKWRDDSGESAKKVSEARSALSAARPVAELSLSTPNGPAPDLTAVDGQLQTKDVTVDATVKAPDGSTSHKNLVVNMQRAVIKTPKGDKSGKWIFTAVKPA